MEERSRMQSIRRNSNQQSGFTLVEVLFVAPIVLLTIAVFVGVLISLTGEVLVARNSNDLAYNAQNALDTIEQDVRLSGAFLATNNMPLVAPQGFNNDTTAFANVVNSPALSHRLVINAIATKGGSDQLSRTPVWLRDSPNACGATNVDQNKVVTFNIIYFIKDETLWRRVLMPTNYVSIGCSVPTQQPSCHPSQTNSICVARDSRLLDNVTGFDIEYFTSASATTPIANASNPGVGTAARQTALNTSDSVKITVSATRSVAGRDATYSGVVRATRIGSLVDYAN